MSKIIRKFRSMLEQRRLWKDYIATNIVAEALGELVGAKPYFMSFDEYKKQRADGENVLTLYSEKPVGLKEGKALKSEGNK